MRLHHHLCALGAVVCLSVSMTDAQAETQLRPWMNTDLTSEARAELMLNALTQDEKIGLVQGDFPRMMKDRPASIPLTAGYVPGVPRLGLPPLLETDAGLGVANPGRENDDATALPSGLALASTWDASIAEASGTMIGKQARQKGFNILLAGGVNLVRDPGNGRNFEYMGEDPLLAGSLAGHLVKGVQSNHIVSTVKHLALNAQETGRMVVNAVIDPAALRESDLYAFQKAIEIGQPGSIMCAYNKVNGLYACEQPELLSAPKDDWGWKGWIMSDWGAVHSSRSAAAGLDQQSGKQLDRQVYLGAPLAEAVKTGEVAQSRLDDMVRRILYGLFSTGLIDHPVQAGGLDTKADARIAADAAAQGLVLLKNQRGLLPLAATARRIAIIGGHADVGVLSGGGSSQVIPAGSLLLTPPKGTPAVFPHLVYHPSSPLEAIRDRAKGARLTFDPGDDAGRAATAAKAADLAIVFATQWTTEGVDAPLALSDGQDAMIAAVAAANPNTIVVLETGGPVLMPWLDQVGAVLQAWYPGSGGGEAIARVLYGEVDAAGRLPVTFPAATHQLPRPVIPGAPVVDGAPQRGVSFDVAYREGAEVGYRWFEKTAATPLFPFGFGLSYASFRYEDLVIAGGDDLTISFKVTNTSSRPGIDTPQVYAAQPGQTRRLVGWSRVALAPGESKTVTVKADPRRLARFEMAGKQWRRAADTVSVEVGKSSADVQLKGAAELTERVIRP